MAKLDTIVHELYHVDPSMQGIRKLPLGKGRVSTRTHSPQFFRDVTRMVKQYLASRPDPALTEFLTHDFVELNARFGRVTGAAFRHFPSFPQRYVEVLADHPVDVEPGVRVERGEAAGRADALYRRRPGRARVLEEDVAASEAGSPSRPLRLLPHQPLQPLAQPIDFRGQTFDVGVCRREVAGAAVGLQRQRGAGGAWRAEGQDRRGRRRRW